ncbi:hypothetical protein Tco_1210517 [Tanacetum coccineum]
MDAQGKVENVGAAKIMNGRSGGSNPVHERNTISHWILLVNDGACCLVRCLLRRGPRNLHQEKGKSVGGSSSGAGAAEESASKADAALSIQMSDNPPRVTASKFEESKPDISTAAPKSSKRHDMCLCSLEAGSEQLVSKGSSKTSTFLASASTRSEQLVSAWPDPRSAPVSYHISRIVFDPMEDSVKTPYSSQVSQFELPEDVVNKTLRIILEFQFFKSSLFDLCSNYSSKLFSNTSYQQHLNSYIDYMYIKSYSFTLFSSLPGVLTLVRGESLKL